MANTNVPQVSLGPTGFIMPSQASVLAGVQADISAAFGGSVNFGTTGAVTPAGQLATSEAAVIFNSNQLLLALFNGVDPAYASGRMQDAIGRIYYLTRIAAASSSTNVTCYGALGTVIPVGALIQALDGNLYSCTTAGTIPLSGQITLPFACVTTGPIACPPQTFTIYQGINGWNQAISTSAGSLGNNVESRTAFETRRQNSVAINSQNTVQAVLGSVLSVANVLSAYVTDNPNPWPIALNAVASIVGSITGNTLTVTNVTSGTISGTGVLLSGSGLGITGSGVIISAFLSGTGGVGTYTVSPPITALSGTLTVGGVQVKPQSLYCCVSGGLGQSVAQAIWNKKPPGCNYTGNTTLTVYDTSTAYGSPGQPYSVTYQQASNVNIYFNVTLKNTAAVPSNAASLVQSAILSGFTGADGGSTAGIGSLLVSSRYYGDITALGSWATLLNLTMGSSANAPAASIVGSVSGSVLTVSGVVSGTLATGQILTGTGITGGNLYITGLLSGTGGVGTYAVSPGYAFPSQSITCIGMTNTQLQMTAAQMPVTTTNFINLILQ